MNVMQGMQLKVPKEKIYKLIHNEHSYDVGLYGAANRVGFYVILKELKHDYKGYIGACTHEEYKAGFLATKDLVNEHWVETCDNCDHMHCEGCVQRSSCNWSNWQSKEVSMQ